LILEYLRRKKMGNAQRAMQWALEALQRGLPQITGSLVRQDFELAIDALERAIKEADEWKEKVRVGVRLILNKSYDQKLMGRTPLPPFPVVYGATTSGEFVSHIGYLVEDVEGGRRWLDSNWFDGIAPDGVKE
jgi:hypothetical protein